MGVTSAHKMIMVNDGGSSSTAAMAQKAVNKASNLTQKYNKKSTYKTSSSSSGSSSSKSEDSYNKWLEERIERMKNADKKNESLINSLFEGSSSLGKGLEMPKLNQNRNKNVNTNQNTNKETNTNQNKKTNKFSNALSSLTNTLVSGLKSTIKTSKKLIDESGVTVTSCVNSAYNWLSNMAKAQMAIDESAETDWRMLNSENTVAENTNIFENIEIYDETTWGTPVIIKPDEGEYEVLKDNKGNIFIKLIAGGGKSSLYDKDGKAMGYTAANFYMADHGIEFEGVIKINGEDIPVKVVSEEYDWGGAALEVVTSTAASAANVTIGYGKGILSGLESIKDGYLIGKSEVDKLTLSGAGKLLGVFGFEERSKGD